MAEPNTRTLISIQRDEYFWLAALGERGARGVTEAAAAIEVLPATDPARLRFVAAEFDFDRAAEARFIFERVREQLEQAGNVNPLEPIRCALHYINSERFPVDRLNPGGGQPAPPQADIHHPSIYTPRLLVHDALLPPIGQVALPHIHRDAVGHLFEWLPHGNADQLASTDQAQPPLSGQRLKAAVLIARDVASALTHLHKQTPAMVHGNLKPTKVLLRHPLDTIFRATKSFVEEQQAPGRVPVPVVSGSGYVSPESWRLHELAMHGAEMDADVNVGLPTDVWSVGMLLARMLTNIPDDEIPVEDPSRTARYLTRALARQRLPGASEWLRDRVKACRHIIDRCLQPDPSARWTMLDVWSALKLLADDIMDTDSAIINVMTKLMPSFDKVKKSVKQYVGQPNLSRYLEGLTRQQRLDLVKRYVAKQVRQSTTASAIAALPGAIPGVGTIAQIGVSLGTGVADMALQAYQIGYMLMGAGIIMERIHSDETAHSLVAYLLGVYGKRFQVRAQSDTPCSMHPHFNLLGWMADAVAVLVEVNRNPAAQPRPDPRPQGADAAYRPADGHQIEATAKAAAVAAAREAARAAANLGGRAAVAQAAKATAARGASKAAAASVSQVSQSMVSALTKRVIELHGPEAVSRIASMQVIRSGTRMVARDKAGRFMANLPARVAQQAAADAAARTASSKIAKVATLIPFFVGAAISGGMTYFVMNGFAKAVVAFMGMLDTEELVLKDKDEDGEVVYTPVFAWRIISDEGRPPLLYQCEVAVHPHAPDLQQVAVKCDQRSNVYDGFDVHEPLMFHKMSLYDGEDNCPRTPSQPYHAPQSRANFRGVGAPYTPAAGGESGGRPFSEFHFSMSSTSSETEDDMPA